MNEQDIEAHKEQIKDAADRAASLAAAERWQDAKYAIQEAHALIHSRTGRMIAG